jgi:hypothetical protein
VTATPTPALTATPTPLVTATPTPVVTATPTPAPLAVSPPSLQFTAAAYALLFTASGYAGPLTATSSDCNGIATFSPGSGVGPSASFAVTSVGAGKCHVTITDAANQKSVVTVDVTTLTGTIQ